MGSKTIDIGKQQASKLNSLYGNFKHQSNNPYVAFLAKVNGLTITYYTSGKLLFQGKNAEEEALKFLGENGGQEVAKKPTYEINPKYNIYMGSDETGNGSYFGGITVTAVYIPSDKLDFVKELGVADSKKMTDTKIISIYDRLCDNVLSQTVVVSPRKYNELTKKYNTDEIKTLLHLQALIQLEGLLVGHGIDCGSIVIDAFCKPYTFFKYVNRYRLQTPNADLVFEEKAESKSIPVACASVIARYKFLEQIEELRVKYQLDELPQGATDKAIGVAKKLVHKHGNSVLDDLAKVHFKTTQKVLNYDLGI